MTIFLGVVLALLVLVGVCVAWLCHTALLMIVSSLNVLIDVQRQALKEHQKPLKLTQVSHGAHGPVKGPGTDG